MIVISIKIAHCVFLLYFGFFNDIHGEITNTGQCPEHSRNWDIKGRDE